MKNELTAVIQNHPLNTMVETHMVSVGGFHICRWADLVALASELTTLRALVAAVQRVQCRMDGEIVSLWHNRDDTWELPDGREFATALEAFEALREG